MKTNAPADWTEIHQRMEAANLALARPLTLSPEDEAAVLKTRALALGREPEAPVAADESLAVVEFELASEHYAFPLAAVCEVSLLRELTPVPCTPPFILGIINLRGDLRTVVDLKTFFHLPSAGLTELNKVLLLQHGEFQLGVLADIVHGVRHLRLSELQPLPPTLTGLGAGYARGLTRDGLILLAPEVILADPSLLVEDEVVS